MNHKDEIELLKDSALSFYKQKDGLIDIWLGFALVLMGLGFSLQNPIPLFAIFLLVPLLLFKLKRKMVNPRIGTAYYTDLTQRNQVLNLSIYILSVMGGLVLYYGLYKEWVPVSWQSTMIIVYGMLLSVLYILGSITRKQIIYAIAIGLTIPLIGEQFQDLTWFGFPVSIISNVALMSLIMFLVTRKKPIVSKELAGRPNLVIHTGFLLFGLSGIVFCLVFLVDRDLALALKNLFAWNLAFTFSVIMIMLLLGFGLAYKTGRFYLYAILVLITVPSTLKRFSAAIPGEFLLILTGLIIIITGVLIFLNFIRRNPIIKESFPEFTDALISEPAATDEKTKRAVYNYYRQKGGMSDLFIGLMLILSGLGLNLSKPYLLFGIIILFAFTLYFIYKTVVNRRIDAYILAEVSQSNKIDRKYRFIGLMSVFAGLLLFSGLESYSAHSDFVQSLFYFSGIIVAGLFIVGGAVKNKLFYIIGLSLSIQFIANLFSGKFWFGLELSLVTFIALFAYILKLMTTPNPALSEDISKRIDVVSRVYFALLGIVGMGYALLRILNINDFPRYFLQTFVNNFVFTFSLLMLLLLAGWGFVYKSARFVIYAVIICLGVIFTNLWLHPASAMSYILLITGAAVMFTGIMLLIDFAIRYPVLKGNRNEAEN